MNLAELQRAMRQLRLGGMAAVLETRLHQTQAEPMAPTDLISCLVSDELTRRNDRLLERRRKQAGFRDAGKTLDNFDFTFNPKMNRRLIFDLATCGFIASAMMPCFSAQEARVRAIWPKRSARPPSCRAIGYSTASPTCCWKNWPNPSPRERANSIWTRSQRYRCSSSMTSACANCRSPRPRIYWRS